jgi:hypothetical protein
MNFSSQRVSFKTLPAVATGSSQKQPALSLFSPSHYLHSYKDGNSRRENMTPQLPSDMQQLRR